MDSSSVRSALVGAAIATVLLSPANADPSMFRGGPAHMGVYKAAPIITEPVVKWRFHTNGRIVSSPAIADNVVYVGSYDRNLYAVDELTGAQRWKFPTGTRVTSSPAIADGLAYFGSYDGNFYAVDAST